MPGPSDVSNIVNTCFMANYRFVRGQHDSSEISLRPTVRIVAASSDPGYFRNRSLEQPGPEAPEIAGLHREALTLRRGGRARQTAAQRVVDHVAEGPADRRASDLSLAATSSSRVNVVRMP